MTPTTPSRYARVLTIAGSDSGGGAGIQADLKTFAALGCYGTTAITALTAQDTHGVAALHPVPADVVKAQIRAVVEDIGVDAVKLGMLHTREIVEVVAWAIDRYALPHVVLDPVLTATSGDALAAPSLVGAMVRELFPRVALVTPNLDEAARFLGRAVAGIDALDGTADALLALGARAVLLKGGHLAGDELVDVLAVAGDGGGHRRHASPRIVSRNLHGTGCTLASAVAAHLALGHALPEAVVRARDFVRGAIAAGAGVATGTGNGPLNHGFAPVPAHRLPAAA
ncbi:bifunctional hydroxymethylpyrimidine kinase/phosphomethylpyrimidine kinase [Variovorax sp. PvP013]|uniref:bifunctional hydroxymethylpyrimidine kinase/phosphomethylpyrimidine kinase n=1 Tax=Variovorax sp. PvP013 TaxID=3156435 RepID=UPI003D1E406F